MTLSYNDFQRLTGQQYFEDWMNVLNKIYTFHEKGGAYNIYDWPILTSSGGSTTYRKFEGKDVPQIGGVFKVKDDLQLTWGQTVPPQSSSASPADIKTTFDETTEANKPLDNHGKKLNIDSNTVVDVYITDSLMIQKFTKPTGESYVRTLTGSVDSSDNNRIKYTPTFVAIDGVSDKKTSFVTAVSVEKIGGKSDKTYVDQELAKKADKVDADIGLVQVASYSAISAKQVKDMSADGIGPNQDMMFEVTHGKTDKDKFDYYLWLAVRRNASTIDKTLITIRKVTTTSFADFIADDEYEKGQGVKYSGKYYIAKSDFTSASGKNPANDGTNWAVLSEGFLLKSINGTYSFDSNEVNSIISVDTSGGAFTASLPTTSLNQGDFITFTDIKSSFATNNFTVDPKTVNIDGSTDDIVMDLKDSIASFVYTGTQWTLKLSLSPYGGSGATTNVSGELLHIDSSNQIKTIGDNAVVGKYKNIVTFDNNKIYQKDGTEIVIPTTNKHAYITSSTTLEANKEYIIDSNGGGFTLTMPSSASLGDVILLTYADMTNNVKFIGHISGNVYASGSEKDESGEQGKTVAYYYDASTWQKKIIPAGSSVDLSDYYTKAQVNTVTNGKADKVNTYSKTAVATLLTSKTNTDLDNLSSTGKTNLDNEIKRVSHDEIRKKFGFQHFKASDYNITGVTGGTLSNVNFLHTEDFILPNKIGGTIQQSSPTSIKFIPVGSTGFFTRLQINIGTNDRLYYREVLNSSDSTKIDHLSIRKLDDNSEIFRINEVLAGDIIKSKTRERNFPIGLESDGTNSYTHVYSVNMLVKAEVFGSPAQRRAQVQIEDMRSSGNPLPIMYEYTTQLNRPIDASFNQIAPPATLLGLAMPTRYISDYVKTQTFWAKRENGYFVSQNLEFTVIGSGWEKIYEVPSGDKNTNNKPNAGTVNLISGKTFGHNRAFKVLLTKSSVSAKYAHIPAGSLDITGDSYTIDINEGSDNAKITLTRASDSTLTVAYVSGNDDYGVYEIESYEEYAHSCDTRNILRYPTIDVANSKFTETGVPTDTQQKFIWTNFNESTGAISNPYQKSGSFTPTYKEKIFESNAYINLDQEYELTGGKAFTDFAQPNEFVGIRYQKSDGSFKEMLIEPANVFAKGGNINIDADGHFTLKLHVDGDKFTQLNDPNTYRIHQIWKLVIGTYVVDNLVIDDTILLAEQPVDTMSHQRSIDKETFTILGKTTAGGEQVVSARLDAPLTLSAGNIVTSGRLYTYQGATRLAVEGQASFATNTWGNSAKFVSLGGSYLNELLDVNNVVPGASNVDHALTVVQNSDGTYAWDAKPSSGGTKTSYDASTKTITFTKSGGADKVDPSFVVLINDQAVSAKAFNLANSRTFSQFTNFVIELKAPSVDLTFGYTLEEFKKLSNFAPISGNKLQITYTDNDTLTVSQASSGASIPSGLKITLKAYKKQWYEKDDVSGGKLSTRIFTQTSGKFFTRQSDESLPSGIDSSKVWSLAEQKTAVGGTAPSGKNHIELPVSANTFYVAGAGAGGNGGNGNYASNGGSTSVLGATANGGLRSNARGGGGGDQPGQSISGGSLGSNSGYIIKGKGSKGGDGSSYGGYMLYGSGLNGGLVVFQKELTPGQVLDYTIGSGGAGGHRGGRRETGQPGENGYIMIEYVGK